MQIDRSYGRPDGPASHKEDSNIVSAEKMNLIRIMLRGRPLTRRSVIYFLQNLYHPHPDGPTTCKENENNLHYVDRLVKGAICGATTFLQMIGIIQAEKAKVQNLDIKIEASKKRSFHKIKRRCHTCYVLRCKNRLATGLKEI